MLISIIFWIKKLEDYIFEQNIYQPCRIYRLRFKNMLDLFQIICWHRASKFANTEDDQRYEQPAIFETLLISGEKWKETTRHDPLFALLWFVLTTLALFVGLSCFIYISDFWAYKCYQNLPIYLSHNLESTSLALRLVFCWSESC